MNWKKGIAAGLMAVVGVTIAGCGSASSTQVSGENSNGTDGAVSVKYTDIKLGETGTDINTTIKILNHRTDMMQDDYTGTSWSTYVQRFNEMYPDIQIDIEGITDYAQDSLLRLHGGDWGDIMMIPEVDKSELPTYFLSYGSINEVAAEANYVTKWMYEDQVYGIPTTAVGRGIVYNKKVFEQAGITELPKTPEAFISALQAIKDKTDAIPLYTNYAAGWTMSAWDDYISGTATGDAEYMNQKLLHTKNPFHDPGDGTHAYQVYKILYDAVANGLTEDDFTTTDWEGSKAMLNNGEIGCVVLGSWAYSQIKLAGSNGADVGYMPFPLTIDGKQYSAAAPDYNYAINVNLDAEKQTAAMIFVKWMAEESGFSYNEGGLPIKAGDQDYPEVYDSFQENDVIFVEDEPAVVGEEDLLNDLNADSELMLSAGGNEKVQMLIEHAANQSMEFDAIMEEWNRKWTAAQEANGVEVE